MKKIIKLLPLFLIALSITIFISAIYKNKEVYLSKFNSKEIERAYYQSQWAVRNSKHPISDTILYAYAGYEYVNGRSPILVNPEHPPLGKYIIGLSIVIFNNEKIGSVLAGGLSLLFIYLILYSTTKSYLSASIGVFLTTLIEPFINQLVEAPQLDIFQLLFFLIFIFIYLFYLKRKTIPLLVLSGIAFGLLFSIKTFPIYFIVFNFWIFVFFLLTQTKTKFLSVIKDWAILNFVALFVYTATYFSFFIHDGSFRHFLGVQKWVFLFYKSSTINTSKLLGDYLGLTFFNKWRFWTDGYPIIKYNGWSILWPIFFVLGLWSTFKIYKKIKDKKLSSIKNLYFMLASFFIVYNLFLFITPIYPRYLLFLFVPAVMITSLYLTILVSNKTN